MSLDDDVRAELRALEARHRLRVPRVVDGMHGPRITLDGIDVINAASNDYLSLAGDRRLARAAANALGEYGTGAGASRLITGTHRRHIALEHALADWLRCDGVRLFNTGYAANTGVLTSLLGPNDVVFSDELNHASIIDGCRLSRAQIVVYPHRDVAALERALSSSSTVAARRRIVVSETLFSMDGDIADVEALSIVSKRHEAALVLDEAHAIGVWGPEGRGIAALAGVTPDVLVGTCGKALGGFGAFAATTKAVADLLYNRARTFVFSTALPPSVAAAVQAAVEIVRGTDGDERRSNLAARSSQLRERMRSSGSGLASVRYDAAVGTPDNSARGDSALSARDSVPGAGASVSTRGDSVRGASSPVSTRGDSVSGRGMSTHGDSSVSPPRDSGASTPSGSTHDSPGSTHDSSVSTRRDSRVSTRGDSSGRREPDSVRDDLRSRPIAGNDESAIAPFVVGDDQRVMAISSAMLEQRVFVQGIRPPTVPEGTARLRISLSAGHSERDIETIAAVLTSAVQRFT